MKTLFTYAGYTLILLGVLDFLLFGVNSQLKIQYLLLHTGISVLLIVLGLIVIWIHKRKNN
jgi:hypothetical protein